MAYDNDDDDYEISIQQVANSRHGPFSPQIASTSKYMKPIGHIPNFAELPITNEFCQSAYLELYLSNVVLIVDPNHLIKLRQKFLVFEDSFQSAVAATLLKGCTFEELRRICWKNETGDQGRKQHDNKSSLNMNYFTSKGMDQDTARACAYAISFYTGTSGETVNRSASAIARHSNGEAVDVDESTEAKESSIILYYLIRGLSHIDFYWGIVSRAVNLYGDELRQYALGALITWIQFSSSMKGKKPPEHFADRGVIFNIYSLTGRRIQQFSNFPDEDEILFLPHSTFLVTNVQTRENGQTYIYMRQIELGLCQYCVMWVDDQIFNDRWQNKSYMEAAAKNISNINVHFIPKISTDAALIFLRSEFGQRLKNKPTFRIVTDMHRDNEYPPENAGARFLLGVRNLGFNCKCLVFTMREAEAAQQLNQTINSSQRRDIRVTTSTNELQKFVTFQDK